jgi:GDSL-like Lipase/Acylhydrolase family
MCALTIALVCPGVVGESTPVASATIRSSTGASYVAMGDSYASGEGIPGSLPDQWLSTTGEPTSKIDGCDRSALAYPIVASMAEGYGSSMAFVACSGATTGSPDDESSFTTGGSVIKGAHGERSQLDALSANTTIVSLTVGGDDLGFSALLASCLGLEAHVGRINYVLSPLSAYDAPGECSHTLAQAQEIATAEPTSDPSLEGALDDTYTRILQDAPNATLYALTYPQLLTQTRIGTFCPLTGAGHVGPLSIYLGFTSSIVKALNELEAELNADIENAAQQVNATNGAHRIVVVNVAALTSNDGQTCNPKTMSRSIVNGILFVPGASLTTVLDGCDHAKIALILRCLKSPPTDLADAISKGSIHPKPAGQAFMAQALETSINSASGP